MSYIIYTPRSLGGKAKHSWADKVSKKFRKKNQTHSNHSLTNIKQKNDRKCVCCCKCSCLKTLFCVQVLPCGDGVLLLLMDTRLPSHSDALNVLPVDAEVGAPDGDGDSSLHGAETWDDLEGKIQWWGKEEWVFSGRRNWNGFKQIYCAIRT